MDAFGRIFRGVHYHFFMYAALFVALLFIVASPRVSDPILNFCLAGVVPGTTHVLAPDVMILVSTAALGLLVVIILTIWLVKRVIRRRAGECVADENLEHVVFSRGSNQPISKKLAASPAAKPASKVDSKPANAAKSFRVSSVIWNRIRRGLKDLLRLSGVLSKTVAGAGIWSMIAIRNGASRLWDWLEPYAAKLDTWLELQCRALVRWLRIHLADYELLQIVSAIWRQTYRNVRQLLKLNRS